MRISDWSSDVCSSDLFADADTAQLLAQRVPLEHAFESQEVRHGGRELDVRCRADRAAVPDVRREAHVKRMRKRGDMPAFRDAGPDAVRLDHRDGPIGDEVACTESREFALTGRDRKSTRLNSSH